MKIIGSTIFTFSQDFQYKFEVGYNVPAMQPALPAYDARLPNPGFWPLS